MAKTKIEWANYVVNPVVGCTKISEGCRNCYAEKMAWRLKCMGIPKYQDVVDRNGWTGKIGVDMDAFNKLPKKPKKVFVVSMGDLFHESISHGERNQIFEAMDCADWHTYLLLTKRPEIAADFGKWKAGSWLGYPLFPDTPWKDHIWLGVTVEHSDYLWRVEELKKIPAAVRFISIEPMLSDIDILDSVFNRNYTKAYNFIPGVGINWVILGAETGPGARPMELDWARDVRDQCQQTDVPFFFKSAGKQKVPEDLMIREFPN